MYIGSIAFTLSDVNGIAKVENILRSMAAIVVDTEVKDIRSTNSHTSHKSLVLDYKDAPTRQYSITSAFDSHHKMGCYPCGFESQQSLVSDYDIVKHIQTLTLPLESVLYKQALHLLIL